jgi:hypothetical protein
VLAGKRIVVLFRSFVDRNCKFYGKVSMNARRAFPKVSRSVIEEDRDVLGGRMAPPPSPSPPSIVVCSSKLFTHDKPIGASPQTQFAIFVS